MTFKRLLNFSGINFVPNEIWRDSLFCITLQESNMQMGIIIQGKRWALGNVTFLHTENWQSLKHHRTNAMNFPLISFGFTTLLHRVLLPKSVPENLDLRAFLGLETLLCCPYSSLEVLQNQCAVGKSLN